MKLDRRTEKLYYRDFFLGQASAKVVKVGSDYIELDSTVAYPEGGGQEADTGIIELEDGRKLRFVWAKKMYANLTGLPDFPGVQVDGVIWHMIDEEDRAALATVEPGMGVTVSIDIERRSRLALSHTASHFLYLGVGQYRPDAVEATIGCHIKTDGARFDFSIANRFSNDELARIEEAANEYVRRDAAITVSAHPQAPDARLWHCEGHVIPCGGIHLDHARPVGLLQVKRKGLGAGKERVSCVFTQAVPEIERYHL